MGKAKLLTLCARIAIDMSKSEHALAVQIKKTLLGLNKCSRDKHISIDDKNVLHIEKLPLSIGENIALAGFDLNVRFMRHKSPLQDDIMNIDKIDTLFEKLSLHGGNLQLNHIGFCYKETDIEEETAKLMEFCRLKKLSLYHETLDGFDPWFFVGNNEDKSSPMLEFLPTFFIPPDWEKSKDYWLPQIQIDLDTSLPDKTVQSICTEVFGESDWLFPLFSIETGIVVYRTRLGIIGGVNINLDIGTSIRETTNYRINTLREIKH